MDRLRRTGALDIATVRIRRPGERRSLSRSASRALDVLEYFGAVRRPLRAVQIARALGISASTTNQLLKTMVDSAHLTFEVSSKTYVPSPRLANFGAWMVASYGADAHIRGLMRELARVTGETVTLATPNDIFMQIIDRVGSNATAEAAERGLRVSIFGSALGSAYLATLADADIRKLARRARVTPRDLVIVLETVANARREGVADVPSPGVDAWSLAIALPERTHLAPLVLGLAGPAARIGGRLGALRAMILQLERDAFSLAEEGHAAPLNLPGSGGQAP